MSLDPVPPIAGLTLVIPAYNEEQGVVPVLEQVQVLRARLPMPLEIIVVDDGSTDRTAERAAAAGATVISHPVNLGYGASLKRGIRRAKHDWIAIMDADASYAVEDLATLIAAAPRYDMVVGARRGAIYQGSPARTLMRAVFRSLCLYVTGRRVPDPNSGLRVFRKSLAMEHLHVLSQGYSFTTSITMLCLLDGGLVGYLPIGYGRRIGNSKVRVLRDTLRSSQILLEVILLYNPLKAFLIFGFLPLLIAIGRPPLVWCVMGGFTCLIWSLGGVAVLLSRRNR